jgi:hypothetical protein
LFGLVCYRREEKPWKEVIDSRNCHNG